jgi:MIP family channel proteins
MKPVTRPNAIPQQASAASRGLHGHSFDANIARVSAAETLGTFVLVLTIICTAIAATLAQPVAGAPYGSLAVPLAGGLVLASMVAGLGPVSGAHLNPAVTVGLALNRRFPWRYVPAYLAAQLAGAVAAALVAWILYGDKARSVANLGAPAPASGVNAWRTFGAEALVTFLLVTVVVSVALNPKVPPGVAAVAIGFALTAAILISAPLTGAGVNPARAIGTMIPADQLTDWWAYLLAPFIGGTLAITLYERVFRDAIHPS